MRCSTGVPGFDPLVSGGLLRDRLYILSGPPGSGKTTFSSHFVTQGAAKGENSLYMTMHETREELVNDMRGYEFGFDKAVRSDRVRFLNVFDDQAKRLLTTNREAGFSKNVSNLTTRLTQLVDSQDISRVVIDSTMLLDHFFPGEGNAVMQFLTALKRVDATTLLIAEMTDPSSYAEEHYLAHGVVFLHNYLEGDGMTRGVQIVKMRGTGIDGDIHPVEFSHEGLTVSPEATVSGH